MNAAVRAAIEHFVRRACAVSGLGGFAFGYGLGALSGALRLLDDDFGLSPVTLGFVPAAQALGLLVGSYVGGRLADELGRRRAIVASDALLAFAALVLAVLPPAMGVVYAGEILAGLGAGLGSTSSIAYVSEVAPHARRGAMTGFYEFLVAFGVLCAFVVYNLIKIYDVEHGWRLLFALVAPFLALAQLALVGGMPESPRWLVARGRSREARDMLANIAGCELEAGGAPPAARAAAARSRRPTRACARSSPRRPRASSAWSSRASATAAAAGAAAARSRRARSCSTTTTTAAAAARARAPSRASSGASSDEGDAGDDEESASFAKLACSSWRLPFTVTATLAVLAFATGGINIRIYAPLVFENAGYSVDAAAEVTVVLGIVKVATTGVAVYHLDTFGRRRLLLPARRSCSARRSRSRSRSARRAAAGRRRTAAARGASAAAKFCVVLGCCVYTAAYQLSFGPVLWPLFGEMFPAAIRARDRRQRDCAGPRERAHVRGVPADARRARRRADLAAHALVCALALAFVHAFVVETRGKEPAEIRDELAARAGGSCVRARAARGRVQGRARVRGVEPRRRRRGSRRGTARSAAARAARDPDARAGGMERRTPRRPRPRSPRSTRSTEGRRRRCRRGPPRSRRCRAARSRTTATSERARARSRPARTRAVALAAPHHCSPFSLNFGCLTFAAAVTFALVGAARRARRPSFSTRANFRGRAVGGRLVVVLGRVQLSRRRMTRPRASGLGRVREEPVARVAEPREDEARVGSPPRRSRRRRPSRPGASRAAARARAGSRRGRRQRSLQRPTA